MATVASGRLTIGKTYLFKNKADSARALNVWCSSSYPATILSNVCLWSADTHDTAQQWKLTNYNNKNVLQSIENTAKYLDLYTGSGDGANRNAHLYSPSFTSYLNFEAGAFSNTVRIRLAGSTNTGHYLTANQGSNGTRTGKTTGAAGNVYFWGTLLSDNSQEWIYQEIDGGVAPSGEYFWPTDSRRINQDYPFNPNSPKDPHYGIDILPVVPYKDGDKIYAYMDGQVSFIRDSLGYDEGYTVRIHHDNPLSNGYERIRTQYMHLKYAPLVTVGQSVTAGQIIGYMGQTGNTTGVHLHFEVRGGSSSDFPVGGTSGYNTGTPIDPADYLALAE